MKKFPVRLNQKVESEGGQLSLQKSQYYRKRYNQVLDAAEKECPLINAPREKGRRGRIKKSKSRNLLERLRQYQDDVLRFMDNKEVPFLIFLEYRQAMICWIEKYCRDKVDVAGS